MIRPKRLIEGVVRVTELEPSRFNKIRLDRNERSLPFSDGFIARVRARVDGERIMAYPEPEPVYEKTAAWLGQPRARLLFNSGSDQSIKAVFETYIGEGDKVLLQRPGYAMYGVYAKMFGAEVVAQDYDAAVLPGGVANPDALRTDAAAVDFLMAMFEAGKPVAAICHGPWTLIEADAVRGRTLTSWPSLRTDLANAGAEWVDEEVHVDGNLITSRRPDDLPAFCRALVGAVDQR